MAPDHLEVGERFQHLLDLPEILIVIVTFLFGSAVSIVVHHAVDAFFYAELVKRPHRHVINHRRLVVLEQHREVVVAAHNLAKTAPHAGVLVPHALNMVDGTDVGRVEGSHHGRKTPALIIGKCKPSIRNHLVGVAVEVALPVVVLVVERLLRLILGPFLGARHPYHHGLVDTASVHSIEDPRSATALLQEVQHVQVRVDAKVLDLIGLQRAVLLRWRHRVLLLCFALVVQALVLQRGSVLGIKEVKEARGLD
mmetsp:Transcript_86132/g.184547  ORF Transcript_86132/g.184547 Transcript_86132/m.184547 type:complete len:253 (+) Transcript_86132:617-1375(+)